MKDVHKPLRQAYYSVILAPNLGVGIGVYDEKAPENVGDRYVILSTQTASDISTFSHFDTEATMLIDIVSIQKSSVSKVAVDEIATALFNIVKPTRQTIGLAAQAGFTITNVVKESDQYLAAQPTVGGFVMRRLIRFSQIIHEL